MPARKKRVMVFGTFDLLHDGHRSLFKQAKQHGNELIVIVARDQTVEEVKGRKPMLNEEERRALVGSEAAVDKALLGKVDDRYALIEKLQPDIICLGYDQDSFTKRLEEKLAERGLSPKIVRLKPFRPDIYKSSKLKENLGIKQ